MTTKADNSPLVENKPFGETFGLYKDGKEEEEDNEHRKQGDLISIFTTWNMMMGTSLLTIPWALQQSGLTTGLVIMLVLFISAIYTAVILLKGAKHLDVDPTTRLMPEFTLSCERFLGKWTLYVNIGSTVILLGGALIVYWILMADLSRNIVNSIYGAIHNHGKTVSVYQISNASSNFTQLNLTVDSYSNLSGEHKSMLGSSDPPNSLPEWTKKFLFPILFVPIFLPILQMRDVTFFSRMTSVGTVSLYVLFAFVITKCFQWGLNISFDVNNEFFVSSYTPNFPALSGLACMSFFVHNSLTTVFKYNKNQGKILHCVLKSYLLSASSYLLVGLGIFLCYPGKKSEIQQNFLNNIPWDDSFSIVVQVLFLFRMMTVLPIVSYIFRVQLFNVLFNQDYPGKKINFIYSLCVITPCVLCAIFFPNVGDILRYVGAVCVVFIQVILPCLMWVYIKRKRSEMWKPHLVIGIILSIMSVSNVILQFFVK